MTVVQCVCAHAIIAGEDSCGREGGGRDGVGVEWIKLSLVQSDQLVL